MPDWLIWFIVIWVLFGGGAGCRWGWRRSHGRRLSERDEDALEDPTVGPARQVPASVHDSETPAAAATATGPVVTEPGAAVRPTKPETPLERLQREFVEGTISLDRYEEEIDRLPTLE